MHQGCFPVALSHSESLTGQNCQLTAFDYLKKCMSVCGVTCKICGDRQLQYQLAQCQHRQPEFRGVLLCKLDRALSWLKLMFWQTSGPCLMMLLRISKTVGINLTVGCLSFAPEHVRQEDTHAKDPPPFSAPPFQDTRCVQTPDAPH